MGGRNCSAFELYHDDLGRRMLNNKVHPQPLRDPTKVYPMGNITDPELVPLVKTRESATSEELYA